MGKRPNAEELWHQFAAKEAARKAENVSLDPGNSKDTVLFRGTGPDAHPVFTIEQTCRPPLVITKEWLWIPCACGKRLHAVTSVFVVEGFSAAVHYKGICFSCGWQEAIHVIEHEQPTPEQIEIAEEVYVMRRTA